MKVDVLQDRKIHCLQMRPYIFQPRNLTGWGSEGVKPAAAGQYIAYTGSSLNRLTDCNGCSEAMKGLNLLLLDNR